MEIPVQNRGVLIGKDLDSNKKSPRRTIILLSLIALAIVVTVLFIQKRHKNQILIDTTTGDSAADDSIISEYKNSSDLSDKRALISAYFEKGDYINALAVAQQVANQAKTYPDFMTILNICGLHIVPNSINCLNGAVEKLKPFMNSISFTAAYGAGGILEKNGDKADAAAFYKRSYDVYDGSAGGYNLMSKNQLKSHISELKS